MALLLRFIIVFQRKFPCREIMDIDNIDIKLVPLNYNIDFNHGLVSKVYINISTEIPGYRYCGY
jgi:hypothetical protein